MTPLHLSQHEVRRHYLPRIMGRRRPPLPRDVRIGLAAFLAALCIGVAAVVCGERALLLWLARGIGDGRIW